MQGLIAIELLYYTWRDKFKDKKTKQKLKSLIKNSIPYVKKNKRLPFILKCTLEQLLCTLQKLRFHVRILSYLFYINKLFLT